MIDGEIYELARNPRCVFAYCERGSRTTSFYIGVDSMGGVHVSLTGCIYGMSSNDASRIASPEALSRFNTILQNQGYKWNKANKVIIKNGDCIIKL